MSKKICRRILATVLPVFLIQVSLAQVQSSDLGKSYYHFSLAKLHVLKKEFSDAIGEFEKAIALNGESTELRIEFAGSLVRAGEISRAVQEGQKAVELDPQSTDAHFFLGQMYSGYQGEGQGGLAQKAVAEFERVVELEPDHHDALNYLGRLYLGQKEHSKAAQAFKRLTSLRPGLAQGHFLRATALVELGEVDEAIQVLERSLELRMDQADSLSMLVRLYERKERFDEAVETYRRALGSEPNPKMQLQLGTLLMRLGRYSEAVSLLREGAARYPQNVEVRVELGKALKAERKFSEAAEVFLEVLKDNPDQMEAKFELARALVGLGQRQKAAKRFEDLIAVESPGSARFADLFRTHLGLLYQDMRQFEKAVELFRQVDEANADDPDSRRRLIYALKDAGHIDEADRLTKDLIARYPDNAFVIMTRAQMLSFSGRVEDGVELLRENLNPERDFELLYLTVSQLYMDHKKYSDAEKAVKEGLARKRESEAIQFQLAAIYERQEKVQDAEAEFKKILQANPEHAGVLNYLGYMFADRGIRLQEARDYIARALEVDPYNGAYLDSLGWVYFKLNQLDLAETNLKKAAELTDDPTIYDHLGDLYIELGQYQKARQYYEQAVSLSSDEEHARVVEKLAQLKERLSP
jgi:tetratricopeptide (TPR) repeat protein